MAHSNPPTVINNAEVYDMVDENLRATFLENIEGRRVLRYI